MKTWALEEIANYYKVTGQKFPQWLGRGMTDRNKLAKTYALAEVHLEHIPSLLAYCQPSDPNHNQLLNAQASLQRFVTGVEAIGDMPKQAPKHRDLLLQIFFEAQEIVIEVKSQIDLYGHPVKSPLKSFPQENQAPF